MTKVAASGEGLMLLPSPYTAVWAARAWTGIFFVAGIGMAFTDPVQGPLLAAAGFVIFGGADSLWTWVKLGSNSIVVTADSVVFHERFRRDRELPLEPKSSLRVTKTSGFLSFISPAYAEFARVQLSGTYEEMEFLAFTDKQIVDLEKTLEGLVKARNSRGQ